jgi:hypothetical protein
MRERNGIETSLLAENVPAVLAARLAAYHARRRALFEWMHPLRCAEVPYWECLRDSGTYEAATLAEAFLRNAGIAVPRLSSFYASEAALAMLPISACLAAFRLRAIFERRDEVHSWIDYPRRKLLAEWVGPLGTRLLHAQRRQLDARSALPHRRAPLETEDADSLAWVGFRLFERECGGLSDGPLALTQFALPPHAAENETAAADVAHEWNPSLWIVSQLPDLFPEGDHDDMATQSTG